MFTVDIKQQCNNEELVLFHENKYCKTLLFGGYLILAILVVKANTIKIKVCQYLIFNTLAYAQLNQDLNKKENLMIS